MEQDRNLDEGIYLDGAATTPMCAQAAEALMGAPQGNCSSEHAAGIAAAEALEQARAQLIARAGWPGTGIFCSGGTEANHLGLRVKGDRKVIVLAADAHASIIAQKPMLEAQGYSVRSVAPGPDGFFTVDSLALDDSVLALALTSAHNLTGVVQPLTDICKRAHELGIHVHIDHVQGLCKISPDWSHVDSASISGHKVHGPKGIGMLLVKDAARHKPLLHGGHQEQGLRPGTTPVPLAVGFAAAADAWQEQDTSRLAALMRSLVSGLSLRGFRVIAPETSRVAIISAVTPGIPGRVLVRALSEQDIFISAGSACEAGSDVPGSALLASGVSAADALHAVRISLHRFSTEADVRTLLASLDLIVPALRQAYGAAVPDAEGPTSDGDTS